jgi:hypothetical protein
MQLFPKMPPTPTTILDITDLRAPNEFDRALLEEEGVRHGGVTIRGASVVADADERPAPPAPAAPRVELPRVVRRLPPQSHTAVEPEAPAAGPGSLIYAGLLSAGVFVAGSLVVLLVSVL